MGSEYAFRNNIGHPVMPNIYILCYLSLNPLGSPPRGPMFFLVVYSHYTCYTRFRKSPCIKFCIKKKVFPWLQAKKYFLCAEFLCARLIWFFLLCTNNAAIKKKQGAFKNCLKESECAIITHSGPLGTPVKILKKKTFVLTLGPLTLGRRWILWWIFLTLLEVIYKFENC